MTDASYQQLRLRRGTPVLTRRELLVAGGVGAGLLVGFALWRHPLDPAVAHRPGEHVFNPYIMLAPDGTLSIIVPQLDHGQGVGTAFAQIVADEMGADWSRMALRPALVHAAYGNPLILDEQADPGDYRNAPMATGGATSIRGFEMRFREAAAAARTVLQMAAADRWSIDWRTLEASGGHIVGDTPAGKRTLAFGALAAAAAGYRPPPPRAFRMIPAAERLYGREVPRLDAPPKLDGTFLYAADVRLPGMLFASIRQAPEGPSRLKAVDRAAAMTMKGVVATVEQPGWVAAIARDWWTADRALDRLAPLFSRDGAMADSDRAASALEAALVADGRRQITTGELDRAIGEGVPVVARYALEAAADTALEPPAATVRERDGGWDMWVASQAPGACRSAVARALGVAEARVRILPTGAGGASAARYDHQVAVQAALIARQIGRPVQLQWSWAEAAMHMRPRPPVRARLTATLDRAGGIHALKAAIAVPAVRPQWAARTFAGADPLSALDAETDTDPAALAAFAGPYAFAHLAVDHHPAATAIPVGRTRAGSDDYTCFLRETFIDELAGRSGLDPLSCRMALLLDRPDAARCLAMVTAIGGWRGGGRVATGPGQGIALHGMDGSYAAVLAEAEPTARGLRVHRLVAAVDVGRIVNPDLVRQQVESALVQGVAAALGMLARFSDGLGDARRLTALHMPTLAQCPDIVVDLVRSDRPPGGASQIALPPVAPALAGAYHAATGHRMRRLPFSLRPL